MWCPTTTRRAATIASLGIGLLCGCQEPPAEQALGSLSVMDPQVTGEEEIFGNIYADGVLTKDPGYLVSLEPADEPTRARLCPGCSPSDLPKFFNSTGWADTGASRRTAWMYGWSDPKAGGNCGDLAHWPDTTFRSNEAHWSAPNEPGIGKEKHCVRPGRYLLTVEHGAELVRQFLIDHVPVVPAVPGGSAARDIWNSTFGVYEAVEATDYNDPNNVWIDVVAHVDRTPGGFTDSSVLDAENVGQDTYRDTFANQATLAGSELDWFRFSVARSGSMWSREIQGKALSRVQWDRDLNPSLVTGFYDALTLGVGPGAPTENQYVIRIHRFDHVTESRTVNVGLETMRPDETPNSSTGVGAVRGVAITRLTPLACSLFEALSTWRFADQYLSTFTSADCSSRGPNIRYRWRFDAGGSWTPYTADTLYDFAGHSSAGHHDVTLDVRNTSTGMSSYVTKTVEVGSDALVLSGEIYIPDKSKYVYYARVNGDPSQRHLGLWHERYNPALRWYQATGTEQDSMTRIWPAGEYSVELRQSKTVSGVLHRGRLHIEVCSTPDCIAPLATQGSVQDLALPVFGAGPWLSFDGASEGLVARLYDLWGDHEAGSPFGDPRWLEHTGGEWASATAGVVIQWRRVLLAEPDVRVFRMTILPERRATPWVFTLAVDPDLGDSPADDRAAYDTDRGMAYVLDNREAFGLLVLDGAVNALVSVQEFGTGRFAPSTDALAWDAQRTRGVLLDGRSRDVQLLASTAERTGQATFTIIFARAKDVMRLRDRADVLLKALAGQ